MITISGKKWEGKFLLVSLAAFFLAGCILIPEVVPTSQPSSTPFLDETVPPTIDQRVETPTDTVMPESTPEPENTQTPLPSKTPIPTQTPVPNNTPEFTQTLLPYQIQAGSPAAISNFAHPSEGCNWLGIIGQVFNRNGKPILNMVVMAEGLIEGKLINEVSLTGVPGADIYGEGSYEIVLSDHVFSSEGDLFVQVFDLNGIPLSEKVFFDTYANCGKNLIILNFVKY